MFVADVHKAEFRLENFTVRRAADLIPPENREGPIVLLFPGLGQARLIDNVMVDDMD